MPIKLNSTGGGSVTLDVPATGSTFTHTLPARTGTIITSADTGTITQGMIGNNVVGKGATFYAFGSIATTLQANADTRITLNSELWDTDNYFDSTTNYRFTPLIAGYYQLNGAVRADYSNAILHAKIYKNGSLYSDGTFINVSNGQQMSHVSSLIYFNGSTDYVDLRAYAASVGSTITGQSFCYLNGFLARAA